MTNQSNSTQDTELEMLAEDNRPEIAPDCFSFRELPEGGDVQPLMLEIREQWKDQAEWGRWTIVSSEHPKPPYPDGLYFEGWSVAPYHHIPPGKEAPFDYPLAAHLKAKAQQ